MKRHSLIIAAICGLITPLAVLAYSDWEGATAQPPGNNPDGPVWLQTGTPTKQVGDIRIDGASGDDIFLCNGCAIQSELDDSTLINIGNYDPAGTGFKLNIDGDVDISGFSVVDPPTLTLDGTSRLNVYEVCLTADSCRTTWPGEASDIWVNTTGDTMTGKLIINAGTDYGLESTTNGVASYAIKGVNTLDGAGGGGIYASCIGGNCDSVRAETTGGGAGVYGASTLGRGVFGTGTTGVLGSGTTQGGWFVDSDSADSGEALLGYGDYGVVGSGDVVGGWFYNPSGSGNTYVGAGETGVQAYGDDYAGYFKDSLDSGRAYLGKGDVGVDAFGTANAGEFDGGVYGIESEGDTAGGRFFDSNSTGVGLVGYGSRSFYAEAGSIDLNDKDLLNVHGFQLKDWDDDTGGTDSTYRLLGRDGAFQFYNGGVVVGNWNNDSLPYSIGTGDLLVEDDLSVKGEIYIRYGDADTYNWYMDVDSAGSFVFRPSGDNEDRSWFEADGDLRIYGGNIITDNNGLKPGGGSWGTYSDIRLKNVIGSYTGGLEKIEKLNPIYYQYKDGNGEGIRDRDTHIGFSAQEVQKVIPEAVEEDENGYLVVDNDPILWTMVNAIKELKAENDELRGRIEALEAE